ASAPVASRRGEAVVCLVAEDLQPRVADDLVVRDRDEAQLGPARRPVDLVRAPLLERLHALGAGNVLVGLHADGVHFVEPVGLLAARDEAYAFGRRDLRGVDRRQVERDGLLPADLDEAAVLEELARIGIAFAYLALQRLPVEAARPFADVGEQRTPDPAPAVL